VGADLLAKWYERNIYMYANLQRLAEPGERILVIVGSGHAPILRELATYDPQMLLVDVLEYLPPE
jgi:pheromone shutdown protein TraB